MMQEVIKEEFLLQEIPECLSLKKKKKNIILGNLLYEWEISRKIRPNQQPYPVGMKQNDFYMFINIKKNMIRTYY